MVGEHHRPDSLLTRKGVDGPMIVLGLITVVVAHLGIPVLVFFFQWLMVKLGQLPPPRPSAAQD